MSPRVTCRWRATCSPLAPVHDGIWKWEICSFNRLCDSSPLHVGDWGITFAMSGGHGRAAGCRGRPADQRCGDDASNEADTAQPPSPWAPEGLLLCMEHHRPPTCTYTYAHLKCGLTFQHVIGWRPRCLIARLYIRGEGK